MRLLSLFFIIATLLSTQWVSLAQEKTPNIPRSSPRAALQSAVTIDKDDTIKVNLVTSIPITASLINDSTKITKNDTLRVNIINLDAKPKQWVYTYYYLDTRFTDRPDLGDLNSKGSEGWELVGVTFYKDNCLVIFKKPL